LLVSARTQIEVIVEAGLLVEGSAEKAIAQDALAKIYKAETLTKLE
jgi:hypothetical protein